LVDHVVDKSQTGPFLEDVPIVTSADRGLEHAATTTHGDHADDAWRCEVSEVGAAETAIGWVIVNKRGPYGTGAKEVVEVRRKRDLAVLAIDNPENAAILGHDDQTLAVRRRAARVQRRAPVRNVRLGNQPYDTQSRLLGLDERAGQDTTCCDDEAPNWSHAAYTDGVGLLTSVYRLCDEMINSA